MNPAYLISELRERAITRRLGGPSSKHTADLLDRAADALEAKDRELAEARAEIERLTKQKGLLVRQSNAAIRERDEAMAALREKEERVKALEAKVASVCGTANRMRDQRDEARDGAYEFVADWHDRQAKLFREMADDEPRTADAARKRAGEAAVHHAASAAALRNRAADDRRARSVLSSVQPVSGSREQRGNEEG